MEDYRGQRMVSLKRQISLLQLDVKRLQSLIDYHYQTEDFKASAREDLGRINQTIRDLGKELNRVEHEL